MPKNTLSIPDEFDRRMMYLERLLAKSPLTEEDVERLDEQAKEAVYKRILEQFE